MKKRIPINTETSIYLIDPDDVLYCHCNDTSTTIYFKNDEPLLVSKQMDAIEKLLEGNDFIRPHKSYLVNRNHISRVEMADNHTLVLTNQVKIPIEEKTQKEILEIIKISNYKS